MLSTGRVLCGTETNGSGPARRCFAEAPLIAGRAKDSSKSRSPPGLQCSHYGIEFRSSQWFARAFVGQGGHGPAHDPPQNFSWRLRDAIHKLPIGGRHGAIPFDLHGPFDRLIRCGKVGGTARDGFGLEPIGAVQRAADPDALIPFIRIARIGSGREPGCGANALEIGAPPIGTVALGRIPARPRTPAPRLSRITRVSA
jgi:hypothetical protein